MATLTERFSLQVAIGFRSVTTYATAIAALPSGVELRNKTRGPRGRWIASPANKDEETTQELINYFNACCGRLNNFPFRDHSDYHVLTGAGVFVQIDSTHWQLYKRYTSGGVNSDRKIVRPLSVTVSGGGSYSVSGSTGILTKSSGADPTGWIGDFDNLCRFDTDEFERDIIKSAGDGEFWYSWGELSFSEDILV